MENEKKNKGGRPKEDLADKVDFDQIEKLAELGHTDAEIGYILGYSEMTINRWKTDERFLLALKRGKAKADSEVVKSLYKRAVGFEFDEFTFERIEQRVFEPEVGDFVVIPSTKVKTVRKYIAPDTTAGIFWLKNRQPDRWRDKQEIQHLLEITSNVIKLKDGTEIEI